MKLYLLCVAVLVLQFCWCQGGSMDYDMDDIFTTQSPTTPCMGSSESGSGSGLSLTTDCMTGSTTTEDVPGTMEPEGMHVR